MSSCAGLGVSPWLSMCFTLKCCLFLFICFLVLTCRSPARLTFYGVHIFDLIFQLGWVPADLIFQLGWVPADLIFQLICVPADLIFQLGWVPADLIFQLGWVPAESPWQSMCFTLVLFIATSNVALSIDFVPTPVARNARRLLAGRHRRRRTKCPPPPRRPPPPLQQRRIWRHRSRRQ